MRTEADPDSIVGQEMKTDSELLGAYVASGDETAFAELVERHGGAVYRACLRQLGDAHEAQDAAQAVFMALVRKARKLAGTGELAAWLQAVARRTALHATRTRANRNRRHQEAAMRGAERTPGENSVGRGASSEEALAALDGELAGLPSSQRQAVMLRYLEGRSVEEAARVSGVTPEALSKRANRGLAGLRRRLERRGCCMSSAALIGLLQAESRAAGPALLPSGLLPSIVAASKLAAAPAAAGAAGVLMEGVLKAMFWTHVKIALCSVTAIAVVGGGTAAVLAADRSGKPAAVPGRTPAPVDSGKQKPSVAEVRYLKAKVAGIGQAWARGDAKAFLAYWPAKAQLWVPAKKILKEIEDRRARNKTRLARRRPPISPSSFVEDFGSYVLKAPRTKPRTDGGKDVPLHSAEVRKLIAGDLKRYFSGLKGKKKMLRVSSIERNGITYVPEGPPPKQKFVPGQWIVGARVSEVAVKRGFSGVVYFTFTYVNRDWRVTGMLTFPGAAPAPAAAPAQVPGPKGRANAPRNRRRVPPARQPQPKAAAKDQIEAQGIQGRVTCTVVNAMPGPGVRGPRTTGPRPMAGEVFILRGRLTDGKLRYAANRKDPRLATVVKAGADGRFKAGLKPGVYTVGLRSGGFLSFGGARRANPGSVTVEAGRWVTHDMAIKYTVH